MASPLQIRPFESADWPGVWVLLEPVFRAGETFPHDPSITEAKALWEEQSQAVLVTLDDNDTVIGSDYLRPNSLCLGAPVANAGYVVAEHCRRQGIGSRLCQHSLQTARRLPFQSPDPEFESGRSILVPIEKKHNVYLSKTPFAPAPQRLHLERPRGHASLL